MVLTREPGGSPGAEDIRRLLVEGDPGRWSPETELLLFNAARRDHVERTILPALEQGAIVISDRFADSSRVYQGLARADLQDVVNKLHSMMIGLEPDITLILDSDPSDALRRGLARRSGEDRFEELGEGFQIRARDGFRALAQREPDRCLLIEATGTQSEVSVRVQARLDGRLDGRL